MQRNRAATFTIGGFRVGFDWSVLIILGLVAWTLATQVMPSGFPGHSSEAYWVAALAAAGLFLGSLVLHELSHAIAARRVAGVEVDDITFWLFGGVARIRGDLPTPRTQLLVAGIGPLTSLGLGLVLSGVAVALAQFGAGSLVAGTVLWVGVMNGSLALFNLIPGSPLDGGRVLHAILWRLRGDRDRAALTAARVGQGLGALLVGLGLFSFAVGGNGGGLWTALIGWFVFGAARSESQIASLRVGLGDSTARQVMSPRPVVGPAWFTVEAFLQRFAPYHAHLAFPVQDFDGRLAGMVSLDTLRRAPAHRCGELRVAQLAIPLDRAITVEPETPAVEVAAKLSMARQSLALVLEEGRLVGVVSPTDLSRAIALGHGLRGGGSGAARVDPVAHQAAPPTASAPPAPSAPSAAQTPHQMVPSGRPQQPPPAVPPRSSHAPEG
jgi:Zn-dependent protease/CBS domain-containing protein